tara:strand:- start:16338 stop:18479 length:2142 start_codon:yes stop_codon:yes gene_type:complete
MKIRNIIILSLLASTTIFYSCINQEFTDQTDSIVEPNTNIESVGDLNISSDFDWKTTQTLSISVILPNDRKIQPLIITNISGTKIYFRGYPDDTSRTVTSTITIPAYLSELRLIYNGANGANIKFVSNGSLSYDFNTGTKISKKSAVSQINLASIEDFTLFSSSGAVSNVGISEVTGDIGTNLGAVSGFGTPSILNGNIQNTNSVTLQTALDLNDLVTQISNTVTTNSSHAAAFGSETLYPGVYALAGASSIAGTLILDAQGDSDAQFIFKIGGALTTGASATVVLINGASSKNIFWVAKGAVSMAASTTISGTLIGNPGAVSMGAGGLLNGRLLSSAGAISLLNCQIIIPENNQSIIELSSLCADPDVVFTITNTGDNMSESSLYTLFKNDVQIISDSYLLNLNQSINITSVATNSDVFKLVVETSTQSALEETIQGCGDNPSEQYSGTLAFEDLWPGKGDYDLNDLVVDYGFNIIKNKQEVVQSITATFTTKAFGASYHNGLGFTLPTVNSTDIISVNGYDVTNNSTFSLASNGLENGQSKATIIVFDDSYRMMPKKTKGIGVNSELGYAYTEPVSVIVEIVFAQNAITYSELNIGAFNPFLILETTVNGGPGLRGKEVHLPNYKPSDLFDTRYFGQYSDDSSPAEGRYFVTANNLPSAINIAETFDWIIESEDITKAYNMFGEWAQSNGTIYKDWYKNISGYRNSNFVYK